MTMASQRDVLLDGGGCVRLLGRSVKGSILGISSTLCGHGIGHNGLLARSFKATKDKLLLNHVATIAGFRHSVLFLFLRFLSRARLTVEGDLAR